MVFNSRWGIRKRRASYSGLMGTEEKGERERNELMGRGERKKNGKGEGEV